MTIPIKTELIRQLIERKFGSVDDLIVEWEHRVDTNRQSSGDSRDRSTVYRWLGGGLPSRPDDIFGFAALLDVDPIALLDIDRDYIHEQFGRERRFFRLNRPRKSQMAALWALYTADGGWPDQKLAETFYGKRWQTADFAHDPSRIRNAYAAITLSPEDIEIDAPKTFHFAYRSVGVSDRMWRPFGTVIGHGGNSILLSERGVFDQAQRSNANVVAECWFGPGPAEFRVVSIHPFALTVCVPANDLPAVRFPA